MVCIYTLETWRECYILDVILCIASYSSLFMFLKCSVKSYLLVGCLNIASYVF
jgi:hypothetical protein